MWPAPGRPEPANKHHSAASHTADTPAHTAARPSETSVVADTAAEPAKPQLAPASGLAQGPAANPAQDIAPPAALPIEEIDLPTPAVPAAKAAERQETDPETTPDRRRRPLRQRRCRANSALNLRYGRRPRLVRNARTGSGPRGRPPLRHPASVAFRSSDQCSHSCNSSRSWIEPARLRDRETWLPSALSRLPLDVDGLPRLSENTRASV